MPCVARGTVCVCKGEGATWHFLVRIPQFPCTNGYRVGKSLVGKWYRLVGAEESKLGGVQGPMLGGRDGVGLGRNEEWLVGIMMEDKLMGGEMVG